MLKKKQLCKIRLENSNNIRNSINKQNVEFKNNTITKRLLKPGLQDLLFLRNTRNFYKLRKLPL